jgi:intein/homing endonuclease
MSLEFKTDNPQPFDSLGLFTYLRTYARRHDEENPNSTVESWKECITRVVNATNTQLGVGFSPEEQQELFDILYNLKASVAGRFLWQLGTRTVDKLGLMSLQNCAFTVIDSPVEPFTWIMNFLMLGAGCGYRISQEDVAKFPIIQKATIVRQDTKDADFIVPDSRQGWIKLLGKVMKAHFYSGEGFTYSCHVLRSKGAVIKGFGGLSSGPEVLCEGLAKISELLNENAGKNMTSVLALDICNLIGKIVVSGNIRRSAQICLGDAKDTEYLRAKRWDLGNVPNWRCYSNNSVICNDISEIIDNEDFWQGYNGNGEPYGLINLKLSRSCGRLGETQYPDPNVQGYNPCAEQSLERNETCCLAEIYLPNITSFGELNKVATHLYRICKHSLTLPCPDSKHTEWVVHKNMRMGIGITGYLQATEEQRGWLSETYKALRAFDVEYSSLKGFPTSIKLTTCKPSGCSRRDMMVLTSRGLMRLDEIGNVEGEEWQKVENLQAYTDKDSSEIITKFYVNGNVETRKIITDDGMELESSLNHKYRVLTPLREYVWKTVKDLEVGDFLVVKLGNHPEGLKTKLVTIDMRNNTTCQKMIQPEYLTRDIAWFLGLFYGDGSVHKKGIRISFNRKQPDLLRWLDTFFQTTFNLRSSIDDDHSYCISSQQFLAWLEANECMKDYAHELMVPKFIRMASKENAIAFIDGFWRADGGINSATNTWTVCTVSERFSKELLQLCRSVGYNVRISCAGPGGLGSRDRWIISLRKLEKSKMRYISKEYRSRMWNDYWLDPIVSIEESRCDTYDIEVENAHHYRIGGIVSHNTLSILGHCTSGVHPGFSQYYIRRIRIASESKLINVAKDHGYHVENVLNFDGTPDYTTKVVQFPYSLPEHTVLAKSCSAIDQMEFVKRLQTEWSDNSVSVTVYYRKEELPEIKEWLRKNYNDSVKTISFLLHSEHGFRQAPLEEITKEQYEEMVRNTKPITSVEGICHNTEDEKYIGEGECVGGACPMR